MLRVVIRHSTMKNLKLLLTAMVCSGLVWASEPSILDVSPHAIASFKTIFQKNQESLDLISNGGSFIEKGKFVGSSQFEVRDPRPLRGGILIWMGEGRGTKNNEIFSLDLNGVTITPQEKKIEEGDRYVYACWANVTKHFLKSGKFKIKMKPVSNLTPPYQGAGWSLFLIYEDPKKPKGNMYIKWGLHKLQPGEIYEFPLISPLRNHKINRVVIIGGHGQKENGSGNALNGETLSIGDDWNGSSGELWDVDEYDVSFFKKEAFTMDKGITLTIDPLLQWLFPVGFVVKTENKK